MKSQEHEFYQSVPRAVGGMAKSYPSAYPGLMHSHSRAQLLYSESGTMKVSTERGTWVVPPERAVWFPPREQHRTATLDRVEMRTLYVDPAACPAEAPRETRMLHISPLVRELIRAIVAMPVEYDTDGRDGRTIALLWEQMDWRPAQAFLLPRLSDLRLQQIEDQLFARRGANWTIEQWANHVGAASRTLTRRFQQETGMSFRSWREHVRAFLALPQLGYGHPVTSIAMELGYETPSAFTAMFRRVMGVTPSHYARHWSRAAR